MQAKHACIAKYLIIYLFDYNLRVYYSTLIVCSRIITVLYKYCYNLDSGAMSDICQLIIQTIVNVDSQIVKFKD